MSQYWSELVGRLQPYVPGEQPQGERLVKLNTNENPYPPSPKVLQAIAAVGGDLLARYPDPESRRLCSAFAKRAGLEPSQVFVGNGSDEVLAHVFQALLCHGKPLLYPDISYSFYPVWCDLYGIEGQRVPLREDFSVDPGDYQRDNGGIIIPNPNAPTGILMGLPALRSLLEANTQSVVVIDEAYVDFGGDSATRLVDEYPNLLVVQTLSKSRSLAGLRVGVAFGQRPLIEALERVKNSFNSYPLDIVAQEASLASLADEDYFSDCCRKVIENREYLTQGMVDQGFEVLPSAANFVFARHGRRAARELFQALREEGVLVRYFDKPRIDNFLRISIGTREDCKALLQALRKIV